ncbi:hypothetical protein BP6252_01487 [Coleophoma cylindrospora]|uniref:Uncharacterized protein n=1 Tax=Coleophoma cylindrospora TaxID=1849047 RepID=A0A3D8ST39_9HELO|nr:hypothetical protein BP6252_01487 [Coleophoma cylindrospora]
MSSTSTFPLHSATPSLKRKTMSVTQTYYLAHSARAKLAHEAGQASLNLHRLVIHANLLDSLMVELAEAEQEQESWFNQSVRGATKSEDRRVQWADQAQAIVEEPEEDWEAEDADSDSSDSDYDSDEDIEMESAGFVSLSRVPSHAIISEEEIEVEDDGAEDYESLALHLTPSRSHQPPELDHDSDSSEDESMPPSPPSDTLPTFSDKQREQIATTSFYTSEPQTSLPVSDQKPLFDEGYYLPQRTAPDLISTVSVY